MLRFGLLERIISFSFSVYACECGVMGYFVGPPLLSPFLLESVRLLNRDCIVPCGIEHFFFTASARYFCFFLFRWGYNCMFTGFIWSWPDVCFSHSSWAWSVHVWCARSAHVPFFHLSLAWGSKGPHFSTAAVDRLRKAWNLQLWSDTVRLNFNS